MHETSTNTHSEVVTIINAVRGFTDVVDRVGAEEFAEATRELTRAQFAWVADRLDDVRRALGGLYEQMISAATEHGAEPRNWEEIVVDLESAGDGVYKALGEMDPANGRLDVVTL